MSINTLSLILAIPATIAAWLAFRLGYLHKQAPDRRGNLLLMWVVIGLAMNAISYAIEINTAALELKMLWVYVRYLGSMTYMLAMLLFTLWCTGRDSWLRPRRITLLGLPLALGILALMTNDFHHLFYPHVWLNYSLSEPQLKHTSGPLYHILYLYVMSLSFYALARLTEARLVAPKAYRSGLTIILTGSLVSLVGFMLYLAGFRLFGILNATSFFMMINAIMLAIGVMRYDLMAFTPITTQTIIQNLGLGLVVLDKRLRVIEFNQAALRLLNLPDSNLTNKQLDTVLSPNDEVLLFCRAQNLPSLKIKRGRFQLELRLSLLMEGAEMENHGLLLSIYDITELRQLEDELRKSEARARLILENSPDLIWMVRPNGMFTYISSSWQRVMGFEPQALLGQHYSLVIHPDDLGIFDNYLRAVARDGLSEQPTTPEYRSRQADGQFRWHTGNAIPIYDAVGSVLYVIGISRDIHEQKLANAERESLLTELQHALNEIRTLSGIVPICASCTQIRDDEGHWHQVEKYVQDHSHAQFSHSLCPDCIKKLYPELPSNQAAKN